MMASLADCVTVCGFLLADCPWLNISRSSSRAQLAPFALGRSRHTAAMAPRSRRSSAASPSPSPSPTSSQPVPVEFEFGGPLGACATMVALPCVIAGLYAACGARGCVAVGDAPGFLAALEAALGTTTEPLLSAWALQVVGGWILLQAALERLLPAEVVEGVVLSDGSRLRYRMNGMLAFWVSLVLLCHCWPDRPEYPADWLRLGAFPLAVIYDEYLQLAVASIVISVTLSGLLYAGSFGSAEHDGVKRLLAHGGNTHWKVYDFFIGRELNPRIGGVDGFDLKVFCELRPGLIGWVVINLGMCAKQLEVYGAVSPELISVSLFQALYVADALYNERAILTTMDITTDGFGYMLAFGDLAWVPFTYSLQARYLVHNTPGLSMTYLAAIWALNICGYALFRLSNGEKDAFRRDPAQPCVSHLKSIQTKRGSDFY